MKMHGTKNSFFIVDKILSDKEMKKMTIEMCQDHTDGVLFVCPSNIGLSKMRIFNRDGSEPEMCGNGLRCFARYILEKENQKEAVIETLKDSYEVKYIDDFYGIKGIEVKLTPVYKKQRSELDSYNGHFKSYHFEYYTVSNPHVVSYTEKLMDEETLTELGVYANNHFLNGMNVNMVTVFERGKIYVQTYERGVGITKSCGTGMTSSTVKYARDHDYFDEDISVYNDGGMIKCRVIEEDGFYTVFFTGNATYYDQDFDEFEAFFEKTQKEVKHLQK